MLYVGLRRARGVSEGLAVWVALRQVSCGSGFKEASAFQFTSMYLANLCGRVFRTNSGEMRSYPFGFLVRRDYELRPTYPSVATPTWCTYDARLLKSDLGKCLARFFRRRFVFPVSPDGPSVQGASLQAHPRGARREGEAQAL